MLKEMILLASLATVSACQSSESNASNSNSNPKAGDLLFDFSKTESKQNSCLAKIKLKEKSTDNISSIKAVAEMYTAGEMFNSLEISPKVGHPLATVLFCPQDVTCENLTIKIIINECFSKTNNDESIDCPSIKVKGMDLIKKVEIK